MLSPKLIPPVMNFISNMVLSSLSHVGLNYYKSILINTPIAITFPRMKLIVKYSSDNVCLLVVVILNPSLFPHNKIKGL